MRLYFVAVGFVNVLLLHQELMCRFPFGGEYSQLFQFLQSILEILLHLARILCLLIEMISICLPKLRFALQTVEQLRILLQYAIMVLFLFRHGLLKSVDAGGDTVLLFFAERECGGVVGRPGAVVLGVLLVRTEPALLMQGRVSVFLGFGLSGLAELQITVHASKYIVYRGEPKLERI